MHPHSKFFFQKTNYHASLRFLFVISLILFNGYLINLGKTYQSFFISTQSLLLMSLFAPLHECSHSTAFKSKFLNRLVMFCCGMIHLMPSIWFREFHMQHHRHTQDVTKDPELGTEYPRTIGDYIFLITGIKIWIYLVKNFFRLLSGNANESYINKHNTKKVVIEARIIFIVYLLFLFVSLNLNNGILLYAWIIPMIIGQPFLRLFLLAEHGLCDLTTDMSKNSRTTKTNFLVRFFMWNMNYHTEHHTTPGIPFHKLQEYQKIIKHKFKYQELGYLNFHKKYLMHLLNQKAFAGFDSMYQ